MGAWTALGAQRGGLADDASSTPSGPAIRGRPRATRPGSSARRTAPIPSTAAGPRGARGLDRASATWPASASSSRPAMLWFAHARTGSRRTPRRRCAALGIPVERLSPAEIGGALAAARTPTTWPSRSSSPRRACSWPAAAWPRSRARSPRGRPRSSWPGCNPGAGEAGRLLDVVDGRRDAPRGRPVRVRRRSVAAAPVPGRPRRA